MGNGGGGGGGVSPCLADTCIGAELRLFSTVLTERMKDVTCESGGHEDAREEIEGCPVDARQVQRAACQWIEARSPTRPVAGHAGEEAEQRQEAKAPLLTQQVALLPPVTARL
jgi:hypothetical protein